MTRRPPRSTQGVSSAASDVYKRQVSTQSTWGSKSLLLRFFITKMGKVHGSLARAGKVRGQTPKVEAQEKKKQKTGRAKKRLVYTKRFVNVVAQVGGRARGPNSNNKDQMCTQLRPVFFCKGLQCVGVGRLPGSAAIEHVS
eukprot:TRINITY_DN17742_c0_g1_i1.p1 TRINITY_DN17742_c0_g1~~TRINITY_DN17742_c0_g1_i1.p1  ORF type:complete len:141 (+),score=26.92 TRINITY_DN17742_c0_g1_i1:107-529(+)